MSIADARTAFDHGAPGKARDLAWRAASAAAQAGDARTLEQVVDLAAALPEAEQLLAYAKAALDEARAGTRTPSAFERLMRRDLRPR